MFEASSSSKSTKQLNSSNEKLQVKRNLYSSVDWLNLNSSVDWLIQFKLLNSVKKKQQKQSNSQAINKSGKNENQAVKLN